MAAKKKSQVSLEFMLVLSFVMLLTVGLLFWIETKMYDIKRDNDPKLVDNFKEGIFVELINAQKAMDGYDSIFFIPAYLGELNYTMQIYDNSTLDINYSGRSYVYLLPDNITGTFNFVWAADKTKYQINLTKRGGVINLAGS